ncbi:hypothetical protein BJ138DRAFT_1153968 [Hygrophoropsis aurantiaca]|uniref:Uncharacterized protein n=1 Tax=Hygrophoropsis aurantiaca TaxID=72124 RepID=A0ACB8AAF2_9AGAM|nr:hypothetical protein BJ138DRAFT_1153968 [Hygrophoropsis aurantiaca]
MPFSSEALSTFKSWLSGCGGHFNGAAQLVEDSCGISVIAQDIVPADTNIVSCPFSLAITRDISLEALYALMGEAFKTDLENLSERQLICIYICFHWVFPERSLPSPLKHLPYIKTLPLPEKLMTPLHFSSSERDAFKGSNLYGASVDREEQWKAEWVACQGIIQKANEEWGRSVTWERYLTASTYLSSRAFPSSLLSKNPTIKYSPSSYPILLPGVDALNHARGQPVSWVVAEGVENTSQPSIALVSHVTTPAGQEIFNNYGPKPNSELILGYGFSLPQNPDDTIILRVGGSINKWEIGRDAQGADGLWAEIVSLVAEDPAEPTYEDDLGATDALLSMLETMLMRLPSIIDDDVESASIRPSVKVMLQHYIQGQRDILLSLVAMARKKRTEAVEAASAQGIDLVFEDE